MLLSNTHTALLFLLQLSDRSMKRAKVLYYYYYWKTYNHLYEVLEITHSDGQGATMTWTFKDSLSSRKEKQTTQHKSSQRVAV